MDCRPHPKIMPSTVGMVSHPATPPKTQNRQQEPASRVGHDQDCLLAEAVDPDVSDQPEEQVGGPIVRR